MRHYKKIVLEPVGGVAGDMLLAALLDLSGAADDVADDLGQFDIPGLELTFHPKTEGGYTGLSVDGIPRMDEHAHHHLDEIFTTIDAVPFSPQVKATAKKIFKILADAEATVHEATADNVHLHEVGQLDSILDIVGIAEAYHLLGAPKLYSLALPSGKGQIQTSHGLLDCPVPCVALLAQRHSVPLQPVDLPGETITPTGIAALIGLECQFIETLPQPATHAKFGVGFGTRTWPDRCNVVVARGENP